MPTLNWLTRDDDLKVAKTVPYRLVEEVPSTSRKESSSSGSGKPSATSFRFGSYRSAA